jgi:hypothetical protein
MKTITRRNSFQTENFKDSVFEIFESNVDQARLREIKKLIGLMWHSTSVMPCMICDSLELHAGSTYAKGARRMRELLLTDFNEQLSATKISITE